MLLKIGIKNFIFQLLFPHKSIGDYESTMNRFLKNWVIYAVILRRHIYGREDGIKYC